MGAFGKELSLMTFLVSSIKEITKDKIIFYDNDYILQEIDLHECSKIWRSRYHHKFNTISLALYEAGWTTFDLG